VRVKLVRSLIGRKEDHKATARALGFRRMHQVVEVKDTPDVQGMVRKISYMLEVVDDGGKSRPRKRRAA
jgi:large subunit ribosomal protein L30